MKADTFTAPGLLVTRQCDRWNGSLFIAWKPSVSMAFRERKALLKFVAWPAKTPTGDRFREWLASFEQQAPEPAPDASELSPDDDIMRLMPQQMHEDLEERRAIQSQPSSEEHQ